jgi:tetratricopeptide (TPR) repeat protein
LAEQGPRHRLALARCLNEYAELLRATRTRSPEPIYDEAGAILRAVVKEDGNDPDSQRELARLLNNRGLFLEETNRLGQAIEHHREGLGILGGLRRRFPDNPDYQSDRARAHLNLGLALEKQRRLAEAETQYREAVNLLEELRQHHPTGPETLYRLATASMNLGNVVQQLLPRPAKAQRQRAILAAVDPWKVAALAHPSPPGNGCCTRKPRIG